jgi:hypothetical protein
METSSLKALLSPDKTRIIGITNGPVVQIWAFSGDDNWRRRKGDLLYEINLGFVPYRAAFTDNDTIIALDEPPDKNDVPIRILTYKRRFRETGLGLFSRFEVWLAILIGTLLIYQGIRPQGQRTSRRTQIHIGTVILLLVVAGGLISENAYCSYSPVFRWNYHGHRAYNFFRLRSRGWPAIVDLSLEELPNPVMTEDEVEVQKPPKNYQFPDGTLVSYESEFPKLEAMNHWASLGRNVGVGIAILAAVAFVSEWLIRRREGRNP